MGSTTPSDHRKGPRLIGHGGVIPLRISTILTLSIFFSLLFILVISLAFLGEDGDEPYFKKTLDDVAQNTPGIVLLGESVDIDIEESTFTVQWSIVGCGDVYVLANSSGVHGSILCGLPSMPLRIFVDGDINAKADYDPALLPTVKNTGKRRNIQHMVQFESDHALGDHSARLYPFDTYLLTTTLRAVNFINQTVPIEKIAAIDQTSNFNIDTRDLDSYITLTDGTQSPSRDADLQASRPGQARAFAILLFAIGWMLTHVCIGYVVLDWYTEMVKSSLIKHLVIAFAILLTLPRLRQSMPDGPAYDGVLIDCIGFFPQSVLSGISVVILLVMLLGHEFNLGGSSHSPSSSSSFPTLPPKPTVNKSLQKVSKPTKKLSFGRTSSIHIEQNDLSRLIRHLNGEFVYPPPKPGSQVHHRNKSSKPVLDWASNSDVQSARSSATFLESLEEYE